MAKKNSLSISFKGWDVYRKKLEELGGDVLREAVEDALKASRDIVAQDLKAAFQPHNKNNKTINYIITDSEVEWVGGTFAHIAVGFDLTGFEPNEGGFPGQYLIYGTMVHGDQHIKPDKDLGAAIWGAAAKKKREAVQEKIIVKAIEKEMSK